MVIYFITNVGRFKKDNGDIDYKNCVIYIPLVAYLVAYMSQLNDFERK
jgi:hypothetical protein